MPRKVGIAPMGMVDSGQRESLRPAIGQLAIANSYLHATIIVSWITAVNLLQSVSA
jgi:hypothetical protein